MLGNRMITLVCLALLFLGLALAALILLLRCQGATAGEQYGSGGNMSGGNTGGGNMGGQPKEEHTKSSHNTSDHNVSCCPPPPPPPAHAPARIAVWQHNRICNIVILLTVRIWLRSCSLTDVRSLGVMCHAQPLWGFCSIEFVPEMQESSNSETNVVR